MLTGGGTGGHITPIIAVARELKQLNPDCFIVYVGERGGQFAHLTNDVPEIDEVRTIFAGKFRRYYGESWLTRLLDIQTNLLNLRDLFLFGFGLLQSLFLVKRINPDVVFLKGGFVGVPIGLCSALWHKNIVTHDSDALPGLANRLVSRWVACHATGMPAKFYNYPAEKATYVGVLVSSEYQPVNATTLRKLKSTIGALPDSTVLLVTGGSLGSQRLNTAMKQLTPVLLDTYPGLQIIHQVGKGNESVYQDYVHDRLEVLEFLKPMYAYTGAADVVVTRAGANTLAELGVQGKACIVVPNPLLSGGHQLKNAAYLKEQNAVLVVDDVGLKKRTTELDTAIRSLLNDGALRENLQKKLRSLTVHDAANKLAVILLEQAESK